MRFEVTALKGGASLVRLALDATDEAAARELARAQGLTVLSSRAGRALPSWSAFGSKRFPLLLFSQELLALLAAGLSLPEALETLAEKETRTEQRVVVERLRDVLFEGQPLSQALGRFPEHFPPLYVASVRAAERTGDLGEALARYVQYQMRLDAVRKKVVSASIYPAVLLAVGGIVALFLLTYVVPRFSAIYAESNHELPWLSKLLLDWGQLLNAHGLAVLGVALVCVVGLIVGFAQLRHVLFRVAARVPTLADRILVYQLARFYRTVGMLVTGGTPLPQALAMVAGLLDPELQARLAVAIRRVREGAGLAVAMEGAGLTTPVSSRMLRVGERGGNMAEMMERIAVFYDDDIARWIDWFTKLFEPLLMACIGIVIGIVVVLMYLPIFELAGSLQ